MEFDVRSLPGGIGVELSGLQMDEPIAPLIARTLQARFQYVHEREENDVMLWDNRRIMHCAFGHPAEEIRIVQRSTGAHEADHQTDSGGAACMNSIW